MLASGRCANLKSGTAGNDTLEGTESGDTLFALVETTRSAGSATMTASTAATARTRSTAARAPTLRGPRGRDRLIGGRERSPLRRARQGQAGRRQGQGLPGRRQGQGQVQGQGRRRRSELRQGQGRRDRERQGQDRRQLRAGEGLAERWGSPEASSRRKSRPPSRSRPSKPPPTDPPAELGADRPRPRPGRGRGGDRLLLLRRTGRDRAARTEPARERGARNALDLSAHNSPELIRNPVDAANLVAANRIDEPRYSCALTSPSTGAGAGARRRFPFLPARSRRATRRMSPSTPRILYMSYVTLAGAANAPNAVWLVRSGMGDGPCRGRRRSLRSAGTRSPCGSPPIPISLGSFTRRGSMHRTRPLSLLEPGNPIKVIRSEDGGRSWSAPVRINGSERERVVAPSPAVGPDGELYVLYLDLGEDRLDYRGEHRGRGGPTRWHLAAGPRRSADRGESWENQLSRTSSSRASASSSSLRRIPQSPWIRTAVGSTRASRIRVRGTGRLRLEPRERRGRLEGPVRVNDAGG